MGSPTDSNQVLQRLSREDFELLRPDLAAVDLPVRKALEVRNRRIDQVYFVDSGFASVVAHGPMERGIEIGLVGREGMTGLAVLLGADRTPHSTFMQLGGKGRCITTTKLQSALERSATLRRMLLRYAHAFLVQTAHTAVANGRGKLEERLARWLLMAHDRVDGDQIGLTHEFLATMLGVRRPGVTLGLSLLERRGCIRMKRSMISVVDRKGLERIANGAYGVPEFEYRRLLG